MIRRLLLVGCLLSCISACKKRDDLSFFKFDDLKTKTQTSLNKGDVSKAEDLNTVYGDDSGMVGRKKLTSMIDGYKKELGLVPAPTQSAAPTTQTTTTTVKTIDQQLLEASPSLIKGLIEN